MARILDSGELAAMRSDGQKTELYLAFLTPDTVYTARVNGLPSSNDELATIVYDGGAGTPADSRAHMSVYVGSSAGAYDKGSVRLREAISAASGTMKLGEMSDVDWADDDYLTIVREWLLRPRHLRIDDSGVVYMDYDITFATPTYNPHLYPAPVPVIACHGAKWLNEQTGEATFLFDASKSYTVGGAGVMTYAWTVEPSGTASFDNAAIAAPTLTVTAADTHTVECVLTWTYTDGARAVSTTTYRHFFTFDKNNPPMKVFKLNGCKGVYSSGGWSFSVTAYDDAKRSDIRDRTLCVLFARDWYGPTDADETSIGPLLSGATPIRENVVCWGWITGESIEWNPEQGTVSFDVQGPHYWLNLMEGFPQGIEDVADDPDAWVEYKGLTPRVGTALFWIWRSTGPQAMDAFIFPDSVIASGASPSALSEGSERSFFVYDAPPMTLGKQISTVVYDAVRAHSVCDRYGRLFIQRDLNEILEADRTGANAPVVMAITNDDWHGVISFDRETVSPVASLDLSGVAFSAGVASAIFALSPGHIPKQYGSLEQIERLALWVGSNSQALANAYCGLLLGNMNNEYPVVPTPLAANNRAFDIAPWQYATLTVEADDTERGISGTFTLIPRRVSFSYDMNSGSMVTNIEWEAEGVPVGGITGDPPPEPPSIPTVTLPPPPTPPEPVPEIPQAISCIKASRTQLVISFNFLDASPNWYLGDPNGDITMGEFVNCCAFEEKAYVITTLGSVWYCADTRRAANATITWTEELSGYAGKLLSLQVSDDGTPYILINENPGSYFSGEWGSLVEHTPWQIPQVEGAEDCSPTPPLGSCQTPRTDSYKSYRQVAKDGWVAGNIHRAPTNRAALFPMFEAGDHPSPLCDCSSTAWVSYISAGFNGQSETGAFIMLTGGDVHRPTGTHGPTGTWPAGVVDTGVGFNFGIGEFPTVTGSAAMYVKSNSLYINGVEYANYSEFARPGQADKFGGLFQIVDVDGDTLIVWQTSTAASTFINLQRPIIWRMGAEWSDPTGDLATVLATNTWNRSRGFWIFEIPEEDVP